MESLADADIAADRRYATALLSSPEGLDYGPATARHRDGRDEKLSTLTAMIERPTRGWRREVATQEAAVAAGGLDPVEAYAAELWPADFTAAVDAVLDVYEHDAAALDPVADEAVWVAVERVVLGLNAADENHGAIETGEREELAEYIDAVLTDAGVDVAALTARRGLSRAELTDSWRDW